jgi:rhodanese-related sulfurtransferase
MDKSQSKILNNGVLIFALIMLSVMVIQWIAAPSYKVRNAEMLSSAVSEERKVLPWQLMDLIRNNRLKDHLIVDLRQPEQFNKGSLPGAINIPFGTILDRQALKQFKKAGNKAILFSDDESQASAAATLLISLGFTEVRTLANDYDFLKTQVIETFRPASAFSKSESARFDFNRYFRTGGSQGAQPSRTQPTMIQTEIIQAQGGC